MLRGSQRHSDESYPEFAPNAMVTWTRETFRERLMQLADEHENSLARLQEDVDRLRLKFSSDQCSAVHMKHGKHLAGSLFASMRSPSKDRSVSKDLPNHAHNCPVSAPTAAAVRLSEELPLCSHCEGPSFSPEARESSSTKNTRPEPNTIIDEDTSAKADQQLQSTDIRDSARNDIGVPLPDFRDTTPPKPPSPQVMTEECEDEAVASHNENQTERQHSHDTESRNHDTTVPKLLLPGQDAGMDGSALIPEVSAIRPHSVTFQEPGLGLELLKASSSTSVNVERMPFALLSTWTATDKGLGQCKKLGGDGADPRDPFGPALRDLMDDGDVTFKKMIISPSHPFRVVWDVVGALLLLYDVAFVPVMVFDPPESSISSTMGWITLVFWSADMVASFFVGFVREGVTIMDPAKVVVNYLKTWFVIDLIVVGPDWVFMVANSESSKGDSQGALRALKVLRAMRTLRLLRLAKLRRLINQIQDRIDSETTNVMASILKLVLLMLFTNHVLACLWYAVGRIGHWSGSQSWIHFYNFQHTDVAYQYFTALHWSLTQFTPGSMSVQPQNTGERAYTVGMLVAGMVMFSSFISSITNSVTTLRALSSDNSTQYWLLRRYLRQHKVPRQLCIRVQRYAEYAFKQHKEMVPASRVRVLALLSENLRADLHCSLMMPNVKIHPLFCELSEREPTGFDKIAGHCRKIDFAIGDNLFLMGEPAHDIAFVAMGHYRYATQSVTYEDDEQVEDEGSPRSKEDEILLVAAGAWLAEQVLWLQTWQYRGHLIAATESSVVMLSGEHFVSWMQTHPSVLSEGRQYAQNFLEWICALRSHELFDVFQGPVAHQRAEEFLGIFVQIDVNSRIISRPRRKTRNSTGVKGFLQRMSSPYHRRVKPWQ